MPVLTPDPEPEPPPEEPWRALTEPGDDDSDIPFLGPLTGEEC